MIITLTTYLSTMLSINVHRCVGLLKCLDVHRAGEVSADDGLFVVVRELEAQEA